jgi:C-terminal processing protease CtpA/Prc
MIRRLGTWILVLALALMAGAAFAQEKSATIVVSADDESGKVKVVVDDGGGWLGVGIEPVQAEKSAKKASEGVLVNDIYEGSPAEKAGIQVGDIILTVDGEKAESVDQLVKLVRSKEPGGDVEVTVLRDGKQETMIATLGERPEQEVTWFSDDFLKSLEGLKALENIYIPELSIGLSGWGGRGRLGVYVDDLTEGLAEYFEVPGGKGVLVEDVVKGAPAEKAGIKPGDVIIRIGDRDVGDTEELIDAISDMKTGTPTDIVMLRKGKEIKVKATVEESEREKKIQDLEKVYRDRVEASRAQGLAEKDVKALQKELDQLKKELASLKEELKKMEKQ